MNPIKIMDELHEISVGVPSTAPIGHNIAVTSDGWQQLRTAIEAQSDELRREREAVTEAHSEIAHLEEELSRTKKELTDAELTWRSMDWWAERYETWPNDIKRKLSIHDLRRMSGWRPAIEREAKESE